MKLVAYDVKKVACNYKRTSILEILEEFRDSDMECAKVEDFPHKNAHSCASSLNQGIKRFRMPCVRAFVRNGEVFLIKELKTR